MLCTRCGHPHAWYKGLCAACAAAAGIELISMPAETDVEIVASAPEEETVETFSDSNANIVLEEDLKPKPKRAPWRPKKAGGRSK